MRDRGDGNYYLIIELAIEMKAGVDLNLGIENETLEFKKSTGELKEAMHSICAILNKQSAGRIIFWCKARWYTGWTSCNGRIFEGSQSKD